MQSVLYLLSSYCIQVLHSVPQREKKPGLCSCFIGFMVFSEASSLESKTPGPVECGDQHGKLQTASVPGPFSPRFCLSSTMWA